jgi:hypothetical protein
MMIHALTGAGGAFVSSAPLFYQSPAQSPRMCEFWDGGCTHKSFAGPVFAPSAKVGLFPGGSIQSLIAKLGVWHTQIFPHVMLATYIIRA